MSCLTSYLDSSCNSFSLCVLKFTKLLRSGKWWFNFCRSWLIIWSLLSWCREPPFWCWSFEELKNWPAKYFARMKSNLLLLARKNFVTSHYKFNFVLGICLSKQSLKLKYCFQIENFFKLLIGLLYLLMIILSATAGR